MLRIRQAAAQQHKWNTMLRMRQAAAQRNWDAMLKRARGETSFTAAQPSQPTLSDRVQVTNRKRPLPVVEPPIEEVQEHCTNEIGSRGYNFGLTADDLNPGPNTVGQCGDSGTPRKRIRIEIDESIQCRFITREFLQEKKTLDRRRGEVASMTRRIIGRYPVVQLSWWVWIYAMKNYLFICPVKKTALILIFCLNAAMTFVCAMIEIGVCGKIDKAQFRSKVTGSDLQQMHDSLCNAYLYRKKNVNFI